MTSDLALLEDYARNGVEASFTALVNRHLDLVHSAALRQVRSRELAEEVAQSVFTDLSRNARRLKSGTILPAWLYQVTRRTAIDVVRREARRKLREQIASEMNTMTAATDDWSHIEPMLDDAMEALDETDRIAVLLRYFENKSLREVGEQLGVSDDAAQKRVSRAVERLREFFTKRRLAVGTSSLVAVLSANAVQAAPVGLAATISAVTCSAGAIAATTAAAISTKAMAMTTLQKTIVTATVAVLAGVGIHENRKASRLRDQVGNLEQQHAPLAGQIQQLERERDKARNQLAALQDDLRRLPDQTDELLRLRGMVGVARRAVGEAEQLRAELARRAVEATNNPVTGAMRGAMKQAFEQQMEGRLSRMTAGLRLTPEQAQAARDILMRQTRAMSAGMQQALSGEFDKAELARLAAEAGNPDEQILALLTPDQQASFPAYQQEEAAHTASLSANQELLQMQFTLDLTAEQLDPVYAALYEVTFNQLNASASQSTSDPVETKAGAMQRAMDQKAGALEAVLTPTQWDKYRQQQALQAKLVGDIMSKMEGSDDAN